MTPLVKNIIDDPWLFLAKSVVSPLDPPPKWYGREACFSFSLPGLLL